MVIYTPKGSNNTIELLFRISLHDLKQRQMPPEADLTERDGLRLFIPESALVRVSETFFVRFPVEASDDIYFLLSDPVPAGRSAGLDCSLEFP